MKVRKILIAALLPLLFGGCLNSGGYTQASVGQMEQVRYGTVVEVRDTKIGDDGMGTILGAVAGGVIGSQIGGGKNTKKLTTAGGAIAGGLAGSQLNQSPGQELLIRTDDGSEFSVPWKITNDNPLSFRAGDRVRIYSRGGNITRILLSN